MKLSELADMQPLIDMIDFPLLFSFLLSSVVATWLGYWAGCRRLKRRLAEIKEELEDEKARHHREMKDLLGLIKHFGERQAWHLDN